MDAMTFFAAQVRERRAGAKLSLSQLAERSGVSKATISKVERRDIQPSLDIAAKLAEAFGATLSEMLHQTPRARVVVLRAADQVEMQSEDGKLQRRVLSPTFDHAAVEFLRFTIAPGASSGVFPPHRYGSEEYIFVASGELTLRINDASTRLQAGDSIYFEAQCVHELTNTGSLPLVGFTVIKR